MKGFKFNGIQAGIKKHGGKDLGIFFFEKPASAAAVFTKNRVAAAPVLLGRDRLGHGICQAVLVNSGNANCCTGKQGLRDAGDSARQAAGSLNIPEEFTLVSSTASRRPCLPVQQFALPLLTRTAWHMPCRSRSLPRSTGAAATRFFVNTAAAEAGFSEKIMPRSLPPCFLIPACMPLNLNPFILKSFLLFVLYG